MCYTVFISTETTQCKVCFQWCERDYKSTLNNYADVIFHFHLLIIFKSSQISNLFAGLWEK